MNAKTAISPRAAPLLVSCIDILSTLDATIRHLIVEGTPVYMQSDMTAVICAIHYATLISLIDQPVLVQPCNVPCRIARAVSAE